MFGGNCMRFKQILSLSLTIAIMFSLVGTITIKASVNNDVQSVNNDVQVEAEMFRRT